MKIAILHTTKGNLEVELYEHDAPLTVAHFIGLVKNNFYDNLQFFKYIPNILIQTGCPFNNGLGNCGFHIKSELRGNNQFHGEGTLSMAHAGWNTASSQFFICLSERNMQYLNGNHTVFGRVKKEYWATLKDLRKGDVLLGITLKELPIDAIYRDAEDQPNVPLKDLPMHIWNRIKENFVIKRK